MGYSKIILKIITNSVKYYFYGDYVILSFCPYTFISLILSSIMIEYRDLALNHLIGGSWGSFEPNGTGLISP